MTELNKCLVEIETIIKESYPKLWEKFNNGLPFSKVVDLLSSVDITNEQLLELYTWRDGIKYDNSRYIGEFDFLSHGKMMPLQESIEIYLENIKQELWSLDYFPLFTTHGGDFLLLDINKSSKTLGVIMIFSPSLWITIPEPIYESLETLLVTVIDCYKEGAYKFKNDNTLEVDYDLEKGIGARNNPKIAYWEV